MSRSFKKIPILKYCGYGKVGKKMANRKVRRCQYLSRKSMRYKKVFEQWNIYDVVSFWTRRDAEEDDSVEVWEKFYHRK